MEGSKHSLFHCSKHFRMCQQTNNAVLIFWQGTRYTLLLMYIHSRLLYNRCSAYARRLTQKTLRLKAKNRASTPAARRSGTPYWGSIYIDIYLFVHHTSRGTINFVSCSSYMHYRVGRNAVALARTLLDYDDDGLTAYAKNLAQPNDEHNVLHIGLVG